MDIDRRTALLAFFAVGLLLASGCLRSLGITNYSKDYASTLTNYTFYDPSQVAECKTGKCTCLVCKNSTSWFGFSTSLVGGSCHFVSPCDATKFAQLIDKTKTPSELPRQFMIGQGYSLSEFADANPWCGNRLDMAVQWLWSNNTPYPLPDADRSMCFLDKNVMPVYVLYSNNTAVSSVRARQIADVLGRGGPSTMAGIAGGTLKGPVGPVIITTEMDPDLNDPLVMANVMAQVREIDAGCGNLRPGTTPEANTINCFVALGARMGDYDGVNRIMQALGSEASRVDLIAFGINAHTVNLSEANSNPCDPDTALRQALRFAWFSLYNWSKPTVIPYVMFDSAGNDSVNSCTWNEQQMVNGYGYVFSTYAIPFQKAGVIGVAAYDFNYSQFSVTNPLNCIDCSLGKNEYRLQGWFASCRSYKTLAQKFVSGAQKSVAAGDNTIVFSDQPGSTCDYNLNPMGILQMAYNDNAQAQLPALTGPNVSLVRCDECMNEQYSVDKPFPVDVPRQGLGIGNPASDGGKNNTYCKSAPEIEFYASKYSIDPMLLRAIAYGESGFKTCAAAKVYATGGVDSGCYAKGYDYVPNPDYPDRDPDCAGAEKAGMGADGKPQWRYCALGLMQVLDPPYTFWPAQYRADNLDGPYYTGGSDQLFKEAKAAGRSDVLTDLLNRPGLAKVCGQNFNPFNTSFAACAGAYEFSLALAQAKSYTDNGNYAGQLGISSDANKARIYQYYLALQIYRGYGSTTNIDTWIDHFWHQKDLSAEYCKNNPSEPLCDPKNQVYGKECYNQPDFVKYVRECEFHQRQIPPTVNYDNAALFYGDYGSRILAIYRGLNEGGCDTASCPSWKKLNTLTCSNQPAGGMPGAAAITPTNQCQPLQS